MAVYLFEKINLFKTFFNFRIFVEQNPIQNGFVPRSIKFLKNISGIFYLSCKAQKIPWSVILKKVFNINFNYVQ